MSARSLALFRTAGGGTRGGGHVMRCMALTETLAQQGWDILFAVDAATLEAVPALAARHRCIEVTPSSPEEEAALLGRSTGRSPAALIVDQYSLDARFEGACRAWAGAVLAIDDLADRPHDCDALVDMAPSAREADYRKLCSGRTRLLLGPSHAILRDQFRSMRREALARRAQSGDVDRIYVSFGWTDPFGMLPTVLEAIRLARPGCGASVVVGPLPPAQRAAVEDGLARLGPDSELHVGVSEIAPLMVDCDLAVGAAGVSALERCVLGLPSLVVVVAENQRAQGEAIAATGAARLSAAGSETLSPVLLAREIKDLADDRAGRATMATAAAALCDGNGSGRVATVLTQLMQQVESTTGD